MKSAQLSDLVLELTESAVSSVSADHQARMIGLISRIVRFDAAWWGWSSFSRGHVRLINSDRYNLPRSFESAVRAVALWDPFIRHGRKLENFSLSLVPETAPVSETFKAFAHAFDLGAMLNGHCRLHNSSFNFFMSLYRNDRNQPFTDEEASDFRIILRHLEQSLSLCLRADMRGRAASEGETALIDNEGNMIRASRGFLPELQREALNPRQLRGIYRTLAERASVWAGEHISLRSTPYAPEIYLVRLRTTGLWDRLSAQERRVAKLLIGGRTARQIATSFRVSPNTVRNQVASIYRKTGAKGKLDLARLLDSDS